MLWFVLLSWQINKRKKNERSDFISRIQKPDIDQIAEILERTKERKPEGFFEKMAYRLEQSGTGWTLQKYLMFSVLSAMFGFFLGTWFFQDLILAFMVGVVGAFLPHFVIQIQRARNLEQFNLNYRNTLLRMSSMLRAGGTIKQAVLDVATGVDAHPMIKNEFRRVHTDLEYGYTIEDALYRMYQRTGSEDVRMTSIVVAIQRKKGGNLAELLDNIQKSITERANAKRKIKTLTAQQRSQANLLTAMPFATYLFFMMYNPDYYQDFLDKPIGQIITVFCVLMIVLGNIIMKRMLK